MAKRITLLLLWAAVLGYFTCSANPFYFHISGFRLTFPRFRDLLIMDIHLGSRSWLISKIGHFSGFFIFDALLFELLRKRNLAASFAILFGVSTELLQLCFARDGRLYDMVIDSLGVGLSYLVMPMILRVLVGDKANRQKHTKLS